MTISFTALFSRKVPPYSAFSLEHRTKTRKTTAVAAPNNGEEEEEEEVTW